MAIRRSALAIVLLALAAPAAALAPSGGVGAQTGSGPSFVRDAIAYTLDEGADGSGTAVAIGRPILVAGAISGGMDACAERASGEFRNPGADPASFIEAGDATATASSVLAVAADCAITYTGSAAARTAGTLEAYSLTVDVSDGVDADGNADASVDDTIKVTVKIVNAATDKLALEAFYDATGGDGWTVNTNWKSATLPAGCGDENRASGCWHAVNTDASGRVTKLDFYDPNKEPALWANALAGNLPAVLGGLSKLTVLELGTPPLHDTLHNQLSGPIPPGIGGLANLTSLGLANNRLMGPIPPELNRLSVLERLNLSGNRLTGPIPDLRALTSLQTLRLGGNQLSGGIPAWVNQLTTLEDLRLGENRLTGPIPDLRGLTSLQTLRLNSNQLSGGIPAWVNQLTTLEHLSLDTNQLTGPIPNLSALTSLRALNLYQNRLSGPVPDLSALTSLQGLSLFYNQLSGPIPDLRSLTSLYLVDLQSNQFTGPIPDLSALDQMIWLALADNRLSGQIPATLGDLDALQRLQLGENQLDGPIPDLSGLADTLLSFGIRSNRLTGGIPDWLGSMTGLTELQLSDNLLTGRIPESLTALTNLGSLQLTGNRGLRCVGEGDVALLKWIAGIRARAPGPGTVFVDYCPVVPPYGRIAITVAEEGDAPEGATYALRLDCGASSFAPTLAAGESYTAPVVAGSVCSLSVTDGQGAREVRGEFAGRAIDAGAAPVTVTLVHGAPEPEPEPTAEEPRDQLESELVAGDAYLRWRGAETPVAEAVAGLAPRVVAVHWWDADAQAWRSWFPDGEALGANTFAMLDAGGIYVFVAE